MSKTVFCCLTVLADRQSERVYFFCYQRTRTKVTQPYVDGQLKSMISQNK